MNFNTQNDNYYQPSPEPYWDAFVDAMEEEGLDPETEDFEAWVENMVEMQEEERAERQMEERRERDWDL